MSTLSELLAYMKGRSRTHGWDAIVAYDRSIANAQLMQQTIERLAAEDEQIPPISGELDLQNASGTRIHLYGIQLNTLHLSFESARRRSQDANVRCAMTGGMVVTSEAIVGAIERIAKVDQLLPISGATLTLHVDLLSSGGSIDSIGGVYIDLHEASEITSTLGDDEFTRLAVARFFKEKFKQLGTDRRRYSLGKIGKAAIPALTPESFDVRVVNRAPGKAYPAAGAGEGLIELYIRFRDGKNGGTPGDDAPELIPDDDQGRRFNGAVLISSRVVFDNVLKPQLIRDLGNGAAFATFMGGSDIAWVLRANAGSFSAPFEHHYKVRSGDFDAVFRSPMDTAFGHDGGQPPLSVQSTGDALSVTWARDSTTTFHRVIDFDWPSPDDHKQGPFHFSHDFALSFDLELGANGVVTFRRAADPHFGLTMSGHEWLPDLGSGELSKINEVARAHFLPAATNLLNNLAPPEIDSFVVRNLLFPGRDVLRPSTAHLPGDLYLAGQIRDGFEVLPDQAVLGPDGTLSFSTSPVQTGVRWTVSGVRGDNEHLGTINASTGVYQAPPANVLLQGFKTIIVTATVGTGSAKSSASTLVNVVREDVAATPLFQIVGAGGQVTIAGFAREGGSLTASLEVPGNGGSLKAQEGNRWTYTAPENPQRPMMLESIILKRSGSNASKKALVLILPQLVTVELVLEGDAAEGGQIRVWYMGVEVPLNEVELTLIGEGSLDAAGRYRPPASGMAGVDVITAEVPDRVPLWGYMVIPRIDPYPKGFRAVRDIFGNIYMSWDALPGVVEYEVTGFERKSLTTALKHSWFLVSAGIGTLSLRGRYPDGQWTTPQRLRFYNMPNSRWGRWLLG